MFKDIKNWFRNKYSPTTANQSFSNSDIEDVEFEDVDPNTENTTSSRKEEPKPERKVHGKRIAFIAILSVIMAVVVFIVNNAINASNSGVEKVSSTSATDSPFWFYFFFIVGTIALIVYYKVSKKMPTAWMVVAGVGLPVFLWLFWSLSPEYYQAWRESRLFWAMIAGIGSAGFLSTFKDPLAVWAKKAILILCVIGAIVSIYYTLVGDRNIFHLVQTSHTDDTEYSCVISKTHSEIVTLPPRYKSTIWSMDMDKIAVSQRVDGKNIVVTYSTNSDDVLQAKIHIYPMD